MISFNTFLLDLQSVSIFLKKQIFFFSKVIKINHSSKDTKVEHLNNIQKKNKKDT